MTEILLHKGHNGVDATAGHEMLFSLKHSWIPYVCVAPEIIGTLYPQEISMSLLHEVQCFNTVVCF